MVLKSLWNTQDSEGNEEKDRKVMMFALIVTNLDTGNFYSGQLTAKKKTAEENALNVATQDI